MKAVRIFIFVLFLFLPKALEAKETICLNMIVKNERHVIERCLESVKNIIDYWVIVDTGSSDGTQDIIRIALKDIPGELFEKPWVNFGHNRSEALQLAKGKADYILLMDADDWLDFPENYELPSLTLDAYEILWVHSHNFSYYKPQIVKATLPWRWEGVLHEYLTCDRGIIKEKLEGVTYVYGGDGARSQDPEKFLKAAQIFREALEKEPNHPRNTFYLAESLRDASKYEEAIIEYENYINIGNWDQEIFWALYQIARLKEYLNKSDDELIESYYKAHYFRPHRAEPIYNISKIFIKNNQYDLAYACIKGWETIPQPKVKDIHFSFRTIEEYELKLNLSLAAYYTGRIDEFSEICYEMLSLDLPDNIRQLINNNIQFAKPVVNKTVLIPILARNKAHVLPAFLKSIENLDYKKDLITIYINTNNNTDNTREILDEWVNKNAGLYRAIIFESCDIAGLEETKPHQWNAARFKLLGSIRNECLRKTKINNCDYCFVVDCDNFVAPFTLKELILKNKPIVAPLLRPFPHFNVNYANFFRDVDEKGYYKDHEEYYQILHKNKMGVFEVPVVHQAYLIDSRYLENLSYIDETNDWEFIVFSRSARKNHISQYICNDRHYGYFLYFSTDVSLSEEQKEWNTLAQSFSIPGIFSHISDLDCLPGNPIRLERYSDLLQKAHIKRAQGSSVAEVLKSYYEAYALEPTNSETLFYLAQYCRECGLYSQAYAISKQGLELSSSTNEWIDKYGMLWEHSMAANSIGNFQEAIDLTNQILDLNCLDNRTRDILKRNLAYFVSGTYAVKHAYTNWGSPPWERDNQVDQLDKPFVPQNQARLHICTMASDYTNQLKQLIDSCTYFGHKLNIIGLNEPFSFGKKLRDYKKFIDLIPDQDIVMCIDAYDVLVLADEEQILNCFYSLNTPVVFSAEINCHPYPHLAQYYPESTSKFKYLNSGTFIGYAGALKHILSTCGDLPDEVDDQGLMNFYYLYHPNEIKLDSEGVLFLTLLGVDISEIDLNYFDKTVHYSTTGTNPCIIHGNSLGKQLYQEIYNHFFNSENPLLGRLDRADKRFSTFDLAFQLIRERGLKTIVETGTARSGINQYVGDGGSTILFSDWAYHHPGTHFYSVDIDQTNIAAAQAAIGENIYSTLVCDDSLNFLKNFPDQIDFLYLDSLDYDFKNPTVSQLHHLEEIKTAYEKLSDSSVVMIDDCDLLYGGKGKLVIDYLLDKNWKIIRSGYQVLLSR